MSERGYTLSRIQAHLALENITVSKKSQCLLIKKYCKTTSVADNWTTKPAKKLKEEYYWFVDESMANDDELTVTKLHAVEEEISIAECKH